MRRTQRLFEIPLAINYLRMIIYSSPPTLHVQLKEEGGRGEGERGGEGGALPYAATSGSR